MGDPVRVLAEDATPHQDAGQVSLVGTASLDWCREHLGVDADRRRIRPNLVVDTSEPFVEETWSGVLTVGGARLRVVRRVERCRMVDIAQEGLPARGPVAQGASPRPGDEPGRLPRRGEPGTVRRRRRALRGLTPAHLP